jgi:hypothetical protein
VTRRRAEAPTPRAAYDRELSRARGARRMLPWAFLTAAGGASLGFVAGGGVRGAAVLLALGLVFAAFLWVTSVARCPSCGAPLPTAKRRPGPAAPDPAGVERVPVCPRCRARFE